MNGTPAFSIVVPVYKVENYLDKCVQSLINQTYSDIEIILVDDGSPDRCPEMCDAYAAQDPRIKVVHKTNGGLSDARNAGIEAAKGHYIIFVDSDDYIELDTCEKLLPFLTAKCDIIIGDGICTDPGVRMSHANITECVDGKAYLKQALKNGRMPMAAVLYIYSRMFLQYNNLSFKISITHEDEEFTPRAFLAAGKVVESGVCFYNYIIREDSITTNKDLRRNAQDLYGTCTRLQKIYEEIDDTVLRRLLLDSLSYKYLSLFQRGRLYQYGKGYIHRGFVLRNARHWKTISKALLYAISPRIYWHINHIAKLRK